MGRKDEEERRERHVAAVERIEAAVRLLHEKPREERAGHSAHLQRFPALRVACRFCRDVQAGEGLVQRFVKVADSRVDRAERRVRCRCEALVPFGDLQACPGGCGRWWAADDSGAWAARLGESDAA
jgi:hypothetical protein